MWVVWLLLALALGFVLFTCIRCLIGRALLSTYKKDSLIIYGKKGKGKTLLFSEMSRMDKRTGYLSTTDFKHPNQTIITYNDVNLDPNTWDNVLNGVYHKVDKKPWEGKSVYLDDAGVFIPNFADSMLKKKYTSLPISFAVWRHLYNAPIHINSQDVDRAWKMIREQADGFIRCRGCFRLFGLAFISCTYYDNIESARQNLCPMPSALFNKYNKAEMNLYNAQHGIIKDFLIFAPTWRNKYDSRYFKNKFFQDNENG